MSLWLKRKEKSIQEKPDVRRRPNPPPPSPNEKKSKTQKDTNRKTPMTLPYFLTYHLEEP